MQILFLNVALVILVYANIASLSTIPWQLQKERFYSLKKHFFLGLKGLKMFSKKSSLI